MLRTVIIGTGDMAYGLAHLFRNNNCMFTGNYLVVTKPSIQGEETFLDTTIPLTPIDPALENCDIVILAIPATELKKFVSQYYRLLRDKILVDVSNSPNRDEDLKSFLHTTDLRWVKAFNDIGAVDIMINKPSNKKKIPSKMCSNNRSALLDVKTFAEESLGLDVKVVPFVQYDELALEQTSLGAEWVHSAFILIFIFAISETYALMRYNVYKGYDWFHLPIQVTNKGICWTAINGFAVTQLPGCLARLFNSVYGDTLRMKPLWLRWGLGLRKELGILSLWFLFVHIMMSLLIFNPKYYGKFFMDPSANSSKMNDIGETSFFFAMLGTGLYAIMGICSLPSVSVQMTWKQWQYVYGPVAWVALAFGTIHVLIMGVKGWDDQDKWPGGLPPITMTSVLLPLFTMFLKVVQVTLTIIVEVFMKKNGRSKKDGDSIIFPSDKSLMTNLISTGSIDSQSIKSSESISVSERKGSITGKSIQESQSFIVSGSKGSIAGKSIELEEQPVSDLNLISVASKGSIVGKSIDLEEQSVSDSHSISVASRRNNSIARKFIPFEKTSLNSIRSVPTPFEKISLKSIRSEPIDLKQQLSYHTKILAAASEDDVEIATHSIDL